MQQSFLEVDRGVAFYNRESIPLSAFFVLQRIFWAAVGLATVALTARERRARVAPTVGRAAARIAVPEQHAEGLAHGGTGLAALQMHQRPRRPLGELLFIIRSELRALVRQAGLYLFVPVVLLTIVPSAVNNVGAFDTAVNATPGTVAAKCMSALFTCVVLLLLFYTVESFERDERARVRPILHASQVSSASLVVGRVLSNVVLGVGILAVAWIACLVLLLMKHANSFSPVPFLLMWCLLGLPTIFLWTSFVALAHGLTRNRFATYGVGLAALIGTGWLFLRGNATWFWNWALWRNVVWSDISTLEHDRGMLVLSRLFALAVGALLLRLAVLAHQRAEPDVLHRPPFWTRFGGRQLLRLSPFWLPALGLGAALWWGSETGTGGERANKAEKEYWKQNSATFRDAPSPDLAFVDLDLDLDPARGGLRVRGSYQLVNRNARALTVIPISLGRHLRQPVFTLDDKPYVPENRSGLFLFRPQRPLAPGHSIKIGFAYHGKLPDGSAFSARRERQGVHPALVRGAHRSGNELRTGNRIPG